MQTEPFTAMYSAQSVSLLLQAAYASRRALQSPASSKGAQPAAALLRPDIERTLERAYSGHTADIQRTYRGHRADIQRAQSTLLWLAAGGFCAWVICKTNVRNSSSLGLIPPEPEPAPVRCSRRFANPTKGDESGMWSDAVIGLHRFFRGFGFWGTPRSS